MRKEGVLFEFCGGVIDTTSMQESVVVRVEHESIERTEEEEDVDSRCFYLESVIIPAGDEKSFRNCPRPVPFQFSSSIFVQPFLCRTMA